MKGNRVVIPTSMRPATLNRLLDAHQGLTSMLQRARRNVYRPKLQDDITEMVHKCDDCQRHGNKKPRTQERQISATRPVEILGMDLVDFCVASTPGQNVHLVLPHNHVVVSSSHLANSSSQLVLSSSLSQSAVELSRRVVESSRRVVFFDLLSRCAITRLFFNSSYYLSTRHVAFQLVMSPFNSSCNDLVHCCWKKRGPKGPGYYNWAIQYGYRRAHGRAQGMSSC